MALTYRLLMNVLLVKHWHGFGGMRDRIDSILPLRIHFIYRNTFPQNTKTEDGEINISESINYIILQMLENFCYSLIN